MPARKWEQDSKPCNSLCDFGFGGFNKGGMVAGIWKYRRANIDSCF